MRSLGSSWARVGVTALLAVASAAAVLTSSAASYAASGIPFTDTGAVGSIGFCDKAGQPITHGSIDTTPFAWRAVSSVAAKAPYNGTDRSATLYAFQPRQDVAPGQWSGEEMTASASYTNPAHPMAAATTRDIPLKYVVQDYPPSWDGLLELRMYLGAYDREPDTLNYPATVIKVTGSTWQVVSNAAPAACGSGKAESIATILLPKPTAKPSSRASHSAAVTSGKSAAATASSGAANTSTSGTAASPSAAAGGAISSPSAVSAASSSSTGSGNTATIVAIIVAIVVLSAIGYIVTRRRGPKPPSPSQGSLGSSIPEKGR